MTITSIKHGELFKFIRIYINGMLHLAINKKKLTNIQAWTNNGIVFFLQLSYGRKKVMVEYDNIKKFKAVMRLIDDNLD